MSTPRPSRKNRRKKYELTGDFEGFWFEMKPVKFADYREFSRAQARMQGAGDDTDAVFDAADTMFTRFCDEWISDHNFVDPDDNDFPVGQGLYAAIDSELLLALFSAFQSSGELPKD